MDGWMDGYKYECVSDYYSSLQSKLTTTMYAIGVLFDASERLVAGLNPAHFITIATPHLGCDTDGDAQVPIVQWMTSVPLIGPATDKFVKVGTWLGAKGFNTICRLETAWCARNSLLQSIAKPMTNRMFGQTGKDLFFMDVPDGEGEEARDTEMSVGGGKAHLPIVERLTIDNDDEGHFFEALRAFATRTAYANTLGDAVVGWANASLRFQHDLPPLEELEPGHLYSSGAESQLNVDSLRRVSASFSTEGRPRRAQPQPQLRPRYSTRPFAEASNAQAHLPSTGAEPEGRHDDMFCIPSLR
eukprot:scaffold123480_cov48-Prasinocladus_malaysianus.AAC.2